MRNKIKCIILLSIFFSVCIWGCISAAALLYQHPNHRLANERSQKTLNSFDIQTINRSLTRYRHYSAKLTGVAMVVHGLNVKPIKMLEITKVLGNMGIEVFGVSLQGHGNNYAKHSDKNDAIARMDAFKDVTYKTWHTEIANAYEIAHLQSIEKNVPFYFVGFSIGGLLGMDLFASQQHVQFDRLILFAPALTIKPYCFQLKMLSFFSNFIVPSATPVDYRSNDGTPIAAYNVLFETISHFHQSNLSKTNVPILIFVDKADEFIYVDGLAQLVESNDLDQWKICYIENLTGKEHIFNHLIIDSVSVGQKTWSRMVSQMHMHLNESLL